MAFSPLGECALPIIEAHDYWLECDPINGGVVRRLTWRGTDILRPSMLGDTDPLGCGMFPLVPFSNRLLHDVPSSNGPLRLPRYLQDCDFAIHGFGWQRDWQVAHYDTSAVELILEDHTSPWPSAYRAVQRFALDESGFRSSISLANIGDEALPAGIGFHPYFPKADCEVAMRAHTKWEHDARGLPGIAQEAEWRDGQAIKIGGVRLDHSYSDWDGKAKLVWPSRGLCVEIEADETLRELVVYSPEEDFFCIEPVSHLTNAMFADQPDKQRGWKTLAPGETVSAVMTISASVLG